MDILPPDPYKALGIGRDASSATIKTAYRKAALKCHPDKVEGKGDEFYKIQQAYEILGDDVKRQQYDDETRLAELRKDVFGKKNGGSMPHVEIRTASFEVRSSSNPMGTAYTARGPTRMGEERRHSASKAPYEERYSEDFFVPRNNSKKYEVRPPPRSSRSVETAADIKLEKTSSKEKERMEQDKRRTREQKQDRNRKYAYMEDDGEESSNSDEKNRHDSTRRRHDDENERLRYQQLKTEPRSSDEDLNSYDKLQTLETEHANYIRRSKEEALAAPYAQRASPPPSSYPRGADPYELRKGTQTERPALLRRSSTTRHKEKPNIVEPPPRLSRRDSVSRRSPEQDIASHTTVRRPATLASTQSTPSNIKLPSPIDDPRRTRTEYPERSAPPPRLQRAETMPTKSALDSRPPPPRTRESGNTPIVSSNLRHAETNDSGYSTSSPSETTPPQPFPQHHAPPTSFKIPKQYFYSESPIVMEESSGNAHVDYSTATRPATILREPSTNRSRHHSPSPPPRDRHVKNPPLSRSASHMHHSTSDRATSRERAKTTTSGSIRRPGLQRSDSSRATTRGLPSRNNATLPQLKTPGPAAGPFATGQNGTFPQYFEEAYNIRSASPQEIHARPAAEPLRTSRKTVPPPREDSGHGPEFSTPWDEEFASYAAAPKIQRVNTRSYTVDSAPGLGRSGTVRETKDMRVERDSFRERERERESPRDRERERERDRDRGERDRDRERDRAYVRERPRMPARRSAAEAY